MTKSNRREGRLDRIGRPQVAPVFSGEVIEGEQDVTVLGQAFARGGVLRLVLFNEFIERFLGIGLRLGLPDFMQIRLGFRLNTFGHLVEHVGRLVNPASLLSGFREDLTK